MRGTSLLLPLLAVAAGPSIAAEHDPRGSNGAPAQRLSSSDLFVLAENALRQHRTADARATLTALLADRSPDVRNEANFRLAKLDVASGRMREAAVRYRQILDQRPDAQPVRLELAAVLARIGDVNAARRELRLARAGTLPPEVARQVDRFSQALRSSKPFGGSLELGMSADSNVNRATRSDTLGTVLGDFTLDQDAKETSGRAVSVDGEAYARIGLGRHQFTFSGMESADLYRDSRFNDLSLSFKAGPSLYLGAAQLDLSFSLGRRWYGTKRFTDAAALQAVLSASVSPTFYGRIGLTAAHVHNHRNRLESGGTYSVSLELEKALTVRTGAGIALTAARQKFRDPGYSTRSAKLTAFAYHDLGRMTLTASGTIGRLAADERLALYPSKRSEWMKRLSLGATFRKITFRGFSPTVQFTLERNSSSIKIYDYRRRALEIGIARSF